jgi:hypothetical protein
VSVQRCSVGLHENASRRALVAVTPVLRAARVVAATPELDLALGYDIATALES